MKKRNIKIFAILTVLMLSYVAWVFYISEPKYIDNCKKKVERYDYVSLPEYKYSFESKQEVINGIVLQVDETKAIVACKTFGSSDFYEIDLAKSEYRIIGKGTIYHKINDFVGFNIMMITQIFIAILSAILLISLGSTLWDVLND